MASTGAKETAACRSVCRVWRQRTRSQCACDISPRATMSRGAIGSSWSAAFVVGVTTFFSNLQAEY